MTCAPVAFRKELNTKGIASQGIEGVNSASGWSVRYAPLFPSHRIQYWAPVVPVMGDHAMQSGTGPPTFWCRKLPTLPCACAFRVPYGASSRVGSFRNSGQSQGMSVGTAAPQLQLLTRKPATVVNLASCSEGGWLRQAKLKRRQIKNNKIRANESVQRSQQHARSSVPK